MLFKLKKLMALILVLTPVLTQFPGVLAADYVNANGIKAYGANTTAGNATILRAKSLISGELINFVVEKPDGLVLTIPSKANENGEATVEMYDYHTRMAGTYYVSAYDSGVKAVSSSKSSFVVYAGEPDAKKSEINLERGVVKSDGKDKANAKVKLMDIYGNLVANRAVKLFSSNADDLISPARSISDADGVASFEVSSTKNEVSVLSALDTTEDLLLNARVNVSFNENYLADAGGDFIKTAYAADVGPLAAFDLADFPTTVKPNDNITFKVKAVDATTQVVQDYTGTVRFSAEGDNSSGVTLPANYKFLAQDLGQHQFNLGLSFAQAGTYKIVVNDLADKFKTGSKTVVVAAAGSGSVTPASTTPKIVLSTPAAGTYSQTVQTVSGNAKGGSNVKIYDNNKEIGNTVTNSAGKFSFQTPVLTDGKHSIYVVAQDAITFLVLSNSDPIDINIDSTPPKIDDIQLDPMTGIKAGSVVKVKVFSEPKLAQAALVFNSDIVPLTASIDDPSIYEGSIQAPADAGAYGLNILVVDTLQNEKTYENQATVNVDPAGGKIDKVGAVTPPVVPVVPEVVVPPVVVPVSVNPPSQVSGVIAYGSDKRVTLVWDAATDDKLVKNYKIYYGEDIKNLDKNISTKDASTTWYIPDLNNGKEFFFAVSAIDSEGNESAARSEIVSGIPFMLEIKNALSQAPTQPLIDSSLKAAAYAGPYPPSSAKSGPELLWIFAPSLGLAGLLKFRKRKIK